MKLFKEIISFFVICYISCLITKIAINGLSFKQEFLLDSCYITLGATLGWFLYDFYQNKKKSRKK